MTYTRVKIARISSSNGNITELLLKVDPSIDGNELIELPAIALGPLLTIATQGFDVETKMLEVILSGIR